MISMYDQCKKIFLIILLVICCFTNKSIAQFTVYSKTDKPKGNIKLVTEKCYSYKFVM